MSPSNQKIKNELNAWLSALIEANGTDLYIKSNSPIHARVKGDIVLLASGTTDSDTVEKLVNFLLGDAYETFKKTKEFDGAYALSEKYRFRVNIYQHLGGLAMVFRFIPPVIKTIEALNLPKALHKITDLKRGLVLVTGSTGSGKSTTLASIIDEINRKHHYHIITIEDPVEYTYNDNKSIIEQREIGTHTHSFAAALRAALRENPDIILVGEIRDVETAESIMQAADTGHLIFSTVHTLDAQRTVDRLISIFPADEQNRIRIALSSILEAVISQRLIKSTSADMIPAVEMMFKSPLIKELIRSKRDNEILDAIEKEYSSYDSISFNRALFDLTLAEKITEEQAYRYATSPADLKLMFTLSAEYESRDQTSTETPSLKD